MKYYIFIITMLTSMLVLADKSNDTGNINNCQPIVNVNNCNNCCKPKVITKIVEKPVEKIVEKEVVKKVHYQNHISLIGGYGPKGNLIVKESGTQFDAKTENGPILGLQYMHDFDSNNDSATWHILLQGQSNRTFMIGTGLSY